MTKGRGVSEGTQFVKLQCEVKTIKIAGKTFDWYHQNKWLYAPADSMRLVHNNTKTAKVAHLYDYSFFYSHAKATYNLYLTIREVQESMNGLFTCRVNELSSRRKPYQIFLVVPSEVSNLLMTIDGKSPAPNTIFDVEEGQHIVQCTASGFNYPNSTHLTITLLLGNESQKVTGKFQGIDMEAAVAAKANRFRASWTFTPMVDRFDTGKLLVCQSQGFVGSSTLLGIRLNVRAPTVLSLLMIIDGKIPQSNTTLDVEEGRHTVLCAVVGSFPTKTQLGVQLFLGNQSQPVMPVKPQEMDKETAIAMNAVWKFTVILERFDSGKQLVCKGTMNFMGVHSIHLNVFASADVPEEKLGMAMKVAIAISVGAFALLGVVLCMVRYCRYIDETFACTQCCNIITTMVRSSSSQHMTHLESSSQKRQSTETGTDSSGKSAQ